MIENCHGRWVFPLMEFEVSPCLVKKIPTDNVDASYILWKVDDLLSSFENTDRYGRNLTQNDNIDYIHYIHYIQSSISFFV